jgi:hypothetical protein
MVTDIYLKGGFEMKHKVKANVVFLHDYETDINEQMIIKQYDILKSIANMLIDMKTIQEEWYGQEVIDHYRQYRIDYAQLSDDDPFFKYVEKRIRPCLAIANRGSYKKGSVILQCYGRGEIGGKLYHVKNSEFKVIYK